MSFDRQTAIEILRAKKELDRYMPILRQVAAAGIPQQTPGPTANPVSVRVSGALLDTVDEGVYPGNLTYRSYETGDWIEFNEDPDCLVAAPNGETLTEDTIYSGYLSGIKQPADPEVPVEYQGFPVVVVTPVVTPSPDTIYGIINGPLNNPRRDKFFEESSTSLDLVASRSEGMLITSANVGGKNGSVLPFDGTIAYVPADWAPYVDTAEWDAVTGSHPPDQIEVDFCLDASFILETFTDWYGRYNVHNSGFTGVGTSAHVRVYPVLLLNIGYDSVNWVEAYQAIASTTASRPCSALEGGWTVLVNYDTTGFSATVKTNTLNAIAVGNLASVNLPNTAVLAGSGTPDNGVVFRGMKTYSAKFSSWSLRLFGSSYTAPTALSPAKPFAFKLGLFFEFPFESASLLTPAEQTAYWGSSSAIAQVKEIRVHGTPRQGGITYNPSAGVAPPGTFIRVRKINEEPPPDSLSVALAATPAAGSNVVTSSSNTATATVTGGTAPYMYTWTVYGSGASGSSSTNSITVTAPGTTFIGFGAKLVVTDSSTPPLTGAKSIGWRTSS